MELEKLLDEIKRLGEKDQKLAAYEVFCRMMIREIGLRENTMIEEEKFDVNSPPLPPKEKTIRPLSREEIESLGR